MMRRATVVLLCVIFAVAQGTAQTPIETSDLLILTNNLRNALRANDLPKAASIIAVLKETLRVARNRALASRIDEEIDTVLGWLPADTETLIVAREPFTLDFHPPAGKPAPASALRLAQGYTVLPFMARPLSELSAQLEGQMLRHAVFAARRFQNHEAVPGQPQKLGLIAWQGCGVYGLPQSAVAQMFSRPSDEMLFGFEIWTMKSTGPGSSPPLDTLFVTRPKPGLAVVCNDRAFLSDLLSRIGVPQAVRTLPPASPLMKAVDRTAPLWAVRRFLPERAGIDPTHPASGGMLGIADPDASGVVLEIGGKRGAIRAQWLSRSSANPWQALAALPALRGIAAVQQNPDGTWQLSAAQESQSLLIAFTLMGVLGFVAVG
jgi:hypothetical protein